MEEHHDHQQVVANPQKREPARRRWTAGQKPGEEQHHAGNQRNIAEQNVRWMSPCRFGVVDTEPTVQAVGSQEVPVVRRHFPGEMIGTLSNASKRDVHRESSSVRPRSQPADFGFHRPPRLVVVVEIEERDRLDENRISDHENVARRPWQDNDRTTEAYEDGEHPVATRFVERDITQKEPPQEYDREKDRGHGARHRGEAENDPGAESSTATGCVRFP